MAGRTRKRGKGKAVVDATDNNERYMQLATMFSEHKPAFGAKHLLPIQHAVAITEVSAWDAALPVDGAFIQEWSKNNKPGNYPPVFFDDLNEADKAKLTDQEIEAYTNQYQYRQYVRQVKDGYNKWVKEHQTWKIAGEQVQKPAPWKAIRTAWEISATFFLHLWTIYPNKNRKALFLSGCKQFRMITDARQITKILQQNLKEVQTSWATSDANQGMLELMDNLKDHSVGLFHVDNEKLCINKSGIS